MIFCHNDSIDAERIEIVLFFSDDGEMWQHRLSKMTPGV